MDARTFAKVAESLRQYRRADLGDFADDFGGKPVDALIWSFQAIQLSCLGGKERGKAQSLRELNQQLEILAGIFQYM